ncbi:hypothetical protein FRC04_005035 [Tulasnella sp. 424]|nr:hypothetical protein FRC04_005035 [Tulasnella sp. 424]KAG8963278.1 hypothetical protein FRC05_004794 [Tulasnella sp. 425]
MNPTDPPQSTQEMPPPTAGADVVLPPIRSLFEDLARDRVQAASSSDPSPRPSPSIPHPPSNAQPTTRSSLPPVQHADLPNVPSYAGAGPTTPSPNVPPALHPAYRRDGPSTQPWFPAAVAVPEWSSSGTIRPSGSTSSSAAFQSTGPPSSSYSKSRSISKDRLSRSGGLLNSLASDSSQEGSQLDPDFSPSLPADFTLKPISSSNDDRSTIGDTASPSNSSYSEDSIDGTLLENELPFRLRPVVLDDRPPSPAQSSQGSRRERNARGAAVPAPCVPGKLTKSGRPYSRTRPDELRVPEGQPSAGRKTWNQTEKGIAWEALREYQRQNPGFDPQTSSDEDQRLAYPIMWKQIMHRLPKRTYDGFLTWASKHWSRPTTRSKSRATNTPPQPSGSGST